MMHYGIPDVYVCNNATTSLHIHIFGVASGMRNFHGQQYWKEKNVACDYEVRDCDCGGLAGYSVE